MTGGGQCCPQINQTRHYLWGSEQSLVQSNAPPFNEGLMNLEGSPGTLSPWKASFICVLSLMCESAKQRRNFLNSAGFYIMREPGSGHETAETGSHISNGDRAIGS